MALGGGTFSGTNKVLPGTYHNFVSVSHAQTADGERGVAAMGLALDWGNDDGIFTVTRQEFYGGRATELFGYEYTAEKLQGLRDLFKGAHTLHAYRLNSGAKAECALARARYSGERGNSLRVVVQVNADDAARFDVRTYLGAAEMDMQTAKTVADLDANAFVEWKPDATLAETAGMNLAGGGNGGVDGSAHQRFLDKLEPYAFNTLGATSEDETVKELYAAYCKRRRDEMGVKFQTVLYRKAANHEGCINLKNKAKTAGWGEGALVYWVTGAAAGCPIHETNLNRLYDGEFAVDVDYTQVQLVEALEQGEFVLHQVGNDVRVLEDINSLTGFTEEKNSQFRENQTVRVIDQVAVNTAAIFNNKYLGRIANNEGGRVSLWSDVVKDRMDMQSRGAIENFADADVSIGPGPDKKSVIVEDLVQVAGAMAKLYITTAVA